MSALVPRSRSGPPSEAVLGRRDLLSAAVVAVAITGFSGWVLMSLPLQAAGILVAASWLAFAGWLRTTYVHPVRSRKVIATYLCAVAFQLVHMSEEYLGGFPHEIVDLFDSPRPWSEEAFLLTFVFGFGALWCLGAAGALYRIRIANYILWFYAVGAGLLNAISHFVFPMIRGGYFPGVYTAAGHLVLSLLLIRFLVQEAAQLKTASVAEPAQKSADR
ncbi:HXXEE domain-containing protein [Blastococcus sp. TF02A_35]|uniref:HXXEE domain-containing protein n=1 Tax=Blastococcus sp. TF02A-35 TaxID=2559612 RepID=UPI0010744469|nr:HXXEE domain-containing protein [Blastococcus sp. TF02A_35]TFV47200.1 HXXEE domain-containing protein [Blastococcus sp. TF02A_35]